MEEEKQIYKCYIDSIQIKWHSYWIYKRLADILVNKRFKIAYKKNNTLVYKDVLTNDIVFNLQTPSDSNRNEYQLLSFNGFKKYDDKRDKHLLETFYTILKILDDYNINYYLNSIDLAIDFYDINLQDLDIKRVDWKGTTKKQSLKESNNIIKGKLKKGDITFYLEHTKKPRKQRAYIYNKTVKELVKNKTVLSNTIYRFEVSLVNLNSIYNKTVKDTLKFRELTNTLNSINMIFSPEAEDLAIKRDKGLQEAKDYNTKVLNEIKDRYKKYNVIYKNKEIKYDFLLVENILSVCNKI